MTQNYENIHHTPDNENLTPRNYAKAKENMNDVTKQLYYGTEANFFKAFQGLSMPPPRVSTAMQERVEPVKLITFTEKIFSPKLKALGNTKLKAPMTLKLTNLQKRLDDVDKALGLPSSARNPDSQRMLSKEEIDQEERNAETIFNFIVQPKKPIKKQNIITTSLKVIRTETSSVSPDKLFYPMSRLETPTNQGLESLRESKPKMKMRNLRQLKTKLDRILLDGIKTEESALMTHGEHRKHFSLSKNSTTKSTKNSINDSQKPIQISKWSYFTKN